MITSKSPDSWRNLQDQVAEILSQCGFHVEVEKTVRTSRGNVELDGYAEEEIKGRKYITVCECKYWKKNIPQEVVHSFRTVLHDLGANVGFVISLNGFQSGAIKAAEFTNIELLTWEDFQNKFEQSWLESYFSEKIAKAVDPLFTYTEPISTAVFKMAKQLSEDEENQFIELKEKYEVFGYLLMKFTHYVRIFGSEPYPELPIINHIEGKEELFKNIPQEILAAESYQDFYDKAVTHGLHAIEEFRNLCQKDEV